MAALRAFGATPEQLEETFPEGEVFPVLPDNWLAVRVFVAQGPRWRRHPSGNMEGLDLAQVHAMLKLIGTRRKARQRVFEQLLIMEQAALKEMET